MTVLPVLETILGIDQGIALVIATVVATAATFGAMSFVLFFAFAPYVSERWREEFGTTMDRPAPTDTE